MATLNNVNLFAPKDPETGKTYELFDADAIKQKQEQSKAKYDAIGQQLAEGNIEEAYEDFTELPLLDQLSFYINPVTGVPIETFETGYFTDQAGLGVKTPKEMLVDVLNPTKNIFQKSFLKAEDPVAATLAPLSALGAIGGIGELANIPKAGLMALRRFQQKTMDGGGGGGIGGLPPTTLDEDVNKFARDGDFVSPTVEALIRNAPKNIKGKQIIEYLNSKGAPSAGIKPKELPYLGIEKFIEENPNATMPEVIEHAGKNKVEVGEVVYRDIGTEGSDFYFDRSTPELDPIDSSYKNNQSMVDMVRDDIDVYEEDLANLYNIYRRQEYYRTNSEAGLPPAVDAYSEITDEGLAMLDIDRDTLIETLGDELYKANPYILIEPAGEGFQGGDKTFAFGNDDVGYQTFINGERIKMSDYGYDDVAYSANEAEIRLQRILEEREDIDIGMYSGDQKYKSYVDNTLPGGKNYSEKVYTFENTDEGLPSGMSHFDEDTQIAHKLGRDRLLEDGTVSVHADEIQSDLHKEGRKYGYKDPEQDAIELEKIKANTTTFNAKVDKLVEKTKKEVAKFEKKYPGVLENKAPYEDVFLDAGVTTQADIINTRFEEIKSIDVDSSSKTGNQRKSAVLTKIEKILATLEAQEIMALERLGVIVNRNEGTYRVGSSDLGVGAFFDIDVRPSNLNDERFLDFHLKRKDSAYADYFKASNQNISIVRKQTAIDRKAPNYPFKGDDYGEMVLKKMILDAINEGKDAISVSASTPILARYRMTPGSDEAQFFERFYDKTLPKSMDKIAKKYGGKFEKGQLDLFDTYGDNADQVAARQFRENLAGTIEDLEPEMVKRAKANILRITPEMKAKIIKEGLPLFNMGGKVTKSKSMDRPIEGNRREM